MSESHTDPSLASSIYEASEKGHLRTAMARITAYRGTPGYTGIHEYYVTCPHCATDLDFPSAPYVERYLRLRCAACEEVFLGEVLRTNLGLRNFRAWQKRT